MKRIPLDPPFAKGEKTNAPLIALFERREKSQALGSSPPLKKGAGVRVANDGGFARLPVKETHD